MAFDMKKFVSERLREMRGDMTQVTIAKRAKIGQATVQRLLAGEQCPSADLLAKLAVAYEVPPAAFLLNEIDAQILKTYIGLSELDKLNVLSYIEFQLAKNRSQSDKINSHKIMRSQDLAALARANAQDMTDERADESPGPSSTKLSRKHS